MICGCASGVKPTLRFSESEVRGKLFDADVKVIWNPYVEKVEITAEEKGGLGGQRWSYMCDSGSSSIPRLKVAAAHL